MHPSNAISFGNHYLRWFFAWWRRELAALMPQALQRWYVGSSNTLLVIFEESRVLFLRSGPAGLRELSSIDLAPLPAAEGKLAAMQALKVHGGHRVPVVLLCLPSEHALSREVCLPLAVEENLRQALMYELDRQTPFKPDQVYFDFRVVGRSTIDNVLKVELTIIPRAVLDVPLGRAVALGLPICGAVLTRDLVRNCAQGQNFIPPPERPRRSRQRLWINLGCFGCALVLLAGTLAFPLWHKRETTLALSKLLLESKAQAAKADLVRDRLNNLVEEHNFPVEQKSSVPSAITLVTELTKLLPDDTWVSQLDLTGKDVQIQGETGSSSKMVGRLEDSGYFKDATYKSPLTQIPGTALERFHIAATAQPRAPHPGATTDLAEVKPTEDKPQATDKPAPAKTTESKS